MSVISQKDPHTLVELANRMHNKQLIDVFNGLETEEDILQDLPFFETNGGLRHTESFFVDLPQAEWHLVSGYVGAGKAQARQIEEECGRMSIYSKVPVDLARLSGNPAKYRVDEDMAIATGLASQMSSALFYGNRAEDPTEINGFSQRYNTLGQTEYGMPVVHNAGGSYADDLTSIWVVKLDRRSVFGLYRQGSQAGLEVRDLGEATEVDTDTGKERQVYRTLFSWEVGLCVRDPRYVHRICNIPTDDLNPDNFKAFERQLINVLNKIPGRNPAGLRIYCNSDVMTQIDLKALSSNNVYYTPGEVFGQPVMFFRGRVPIRRCDAILSTEEEVT